MLQRGISMGLRCMKVTKNFLNQTVVVQWHDPRTAAERMSIDEAPKGLKALARWEEYGFLDDITEGVIRLRYCHAWDSEALVPDEALFAWIPEDLITHIAILEVKKEGNPA